ncbi:MAG: ATP synthase subunit I [Cycloclasticus sp.]|nr:ATP synthase subunit I [Cycloclasticus sp.]
MVALKGLFPEHIDLSSIVYGGFISVMTSMVMVIRINQAARKVSEGSQRGNLYVYLGAIERLCVSLVLFGLGFMWLKLLPMPMIIGLIAGQVGFAIGGFKVKD